MAVPRWYAPAQKNSPARLPAVIDTKSAWTPKKTRGGIKGFRAVRDAVRHQSFRFCLGIE